VRIEIGSHTVVGDEPSSVGGEDLGPSPIDLLTAALAESIAMTSRGYTLQHGWPLDGISVAVSHSRGVPTDASEPTDAFQAVILLEAEQLSDEQKARVVDAASRCPIRRILQDAHPISIKVAKRSEELFDV
jgi:putative redox protein